MCASNGIIGLGGEAEILFWRWFSAERTELLFVFPEIFLQGGQETFGVAGTDDHPADELALGRHQRQKIKDHFLFGVADLNCVGIPALKRLVAGFELDLLFGHRLDND